MQCRYNVGSNQWPSNWELTATEVGLLSILWWYNHNRWNCLCPQLEVPTMKQDRRVSPLLHILSSVLNQGSTGGVYMEQIPEEIFRLFYLEEGGRKIQRRNYSRASFSRFIFFLEDANIADSGFFSITEGKPPGEGTSHQLCKLIFTSPGMWVSIRKHA